jgi:hypothetical protein
MRGYDTKEKAKITAGRLAALIMTGRLAESLPSTD